MPLISPTFIEEPQPQKDRPQYHPPMGLSAWEDKRRVELLLNVPPWKCECGIVNHGRVIECCGRFKPSNPCNRRRPSNYSKGDVFKPGNDFNPWLKD